MDLGRKIERIRGLSGAMGEGKGRLEIEYLSIGWATMDGGCVVMRRYGEGPGLWHSPGGDVV